VKFLLTFNKYYVKRGKFLLTFNKYCVKRGKFLLNFSKYYVKRGTFLLTFNVYYVKRGKFLQTFNKYYVKRGKFLLTLKKYYVKRGKCLLTFIIYKFKYYIRTLTVKFSSLPLEKNYGCLRDKCWGKWLDLRYMRWLVSFILDSFISSIINSMHWGIIRQSDHITSMSK
jgi:hypothetical protein